VNVFAVEGTIWFVIFLVLLVVKAVAFVSALVYPTQAYEATGKLTKPAWSVILGLGLVAQLLMGGLGIINLIFTVAAFVYLADVRPALREVTPRR
jgi:uncharacterized membrane protein